MASKRCKSPIADRPAKAGKISMNSYACPIVHVKILVGKENTALYLSKELLCQRSEFFKRACNELWESGRTNTVILDEEDPEIFSIFATWLVKDSLTESAELLEIPDFSDDEILSDWHLMSYQAVFLQLVKCFVLGDYLQSVEFRNAVMNLLIAGEQSITAIFHVIPSAEVVNFTWNNTQVDSPLRHLILDIFINSCSMIELVEAGSLGTATFYQELAGRTITFMRAYKTRGVWKGDRCRYHHHFEPEDALRCKKLHVKGKHHFTTP